MRRGAWMAVWWLLAWAPALAQEPLPLRLGWRAPAECPDAEAVEAELAQLARVRPGFVLQRLDAEIEVTRAGHTYHAQMHTLRAGQRGARELEAHDCTTLIKTVALVLALAFGEGVEIGTHSSAPATEAAPAEPAAPARRDDADAGPAATERAKHPPQADPTLDPASPAWRYLIGAGAQFGLLGSVMASVSAQLELAWAALQLGVRATGSFAPERAVSADIDARFAAASAALQACGALGLGPISGALCGAGHVGLLHGSSSGAVEGSSNAPWGALSAQLALTWPRTSRLRLRLQGGLAVSLYQARFVIEGLGTVERVERLVPEVALLLVFAP